MEQILTDDFRWRNFNGLDWLLANRNMYMDGDEGSIELYVMDVEGRRLHIKAYACPTLEEAKEIRAMLDIHIQVMEALQKRYND